MDITHTLGLRNPNYCVGLLLRPHILDKVHRAQHFSRSEDKRDWVEVKMPGPDDQLHGRSGRGTESNPFGAFIPR